MRSHVDGRRANPSHRSRLVQDILRVEILRDVESIIDLAHDVLPECGTERDATLRRLRAVAARCREPIVVSCLDRRRAYADARVVCALGDGLPSGARAEAVRAREWDASDIAGDIAVVFADAADADDSSLCVALDAARARVRDEKNVFCVIENASGDGDSVDVSSLVGLCGDCRVVDAVRLLGSVSSDDDFDDDFDDDDETVSTLAWAEATIDERKLVAAIASRVKHLIQTRVRDILREYQPMRDCVTFWTAARSRCATVDAIASSSAANHMLERIIVGAVEGVPSVGVLGASALAARHRESNPNLDAGALKRMIYADSTKSFAAGTVLSLGGPLAAPITALPALVMYFTIRVRLCVAIAILGAADEGASALEPKIIVSALACFFGADANALLTARPLVEEFDVDDLMDDLESTSAFDRGMFTDDGDDGETGTSQSQSFAEALNAKLKKLSDDAKEKTAAAIRSVTECGSRATRDAQRAAAKQAARIRAYAAARGAEPGVVNRLADDAFARALSVELYREMSRSVFTAANMPILIAELMPAVSSYLTIRAASTAMRCHIPERDIRDIDVVDDVPDAVDGEDAPSVMDTAKTKIADVASATSASFTAAGEATTRAFSEMNRSLSKLWRP